MKAAIYYRVSSEEQVDGYSLDAQRRALLDFCASKGWEVVEEYADEGKSARGDDIAKRPAFKRMMEDAEARRMDVVVVHKLDRFARNIRVTFESLARLDKCGVAFTTVVEYQFDFTTPMGKVMLSLLAAFAQYYSDNLSQETKKGKAERKAQGLYNGWLPFGVTKNSDGIPVLDPDTSPGLFLAFRMAAAGHSDREIAVALNERGFRTTGNHGPKLFSKDTIRKILTNRFYLGELTDGQRGWLAGAHGPLLDDHLFDAAQATRERNLANPNPVKVTVPARTYSLSGLVVCGHCGGNLHFNMSKQGRPRVYCYQRDQTAKCRQRSTFLEVYERQIAEHLALFSMPADYRQQILDLYAQARRDGDDRAARRAQVTRQLERLKDLYTMGDLERAAYLADRDRLSRELLLLDQADDSGRLIEECAKLLDDICASWEDASQEHRNQLARVLFSEVRIRDHEVTDLKPRPEFAAFFQLAGCEPVGDDKSEGEKMDGADTQHRPETLRGGSDGIRTRGLCLDRAACGASMWRYECERAAGY